VSLHDKDSDTFQNYFIDMASRSELLPEEKLTPEETLTLSVYDRQEPLLRSTNEMEPCYGRLQAMLKRLYIRSICAVPLTTAHRKLGAITFGSKQVDTYSPNEIRFVSQVAAYIALAFDDALNFAALRRASEELQNRNDRLQLLLDVTNQVVSNLELRNLLHAISLDVRRVMQCDYAGLSLPDAENKQLRLYAVDFPEGKGFLQEDLVYSIEGSPSGTAFRTMKPLTLQRPFAGWLHYPIVQIAVREGLKSFCFLPLISRNRAIGTLVLGRLRDDAFTQADTGFLTQIANQIALAVENALAYREIRELKEQLAKEKLYLEDEIRSEMNFAQIIGNSASLRRVLKRVETVAPTDSTVLIYGETGTGKELIARGIHDLSPRRSKPFVKLNCAAIPTGLLESELFGHEKGAFTGAIAQRIGRFEVADGGTIFLDEIGEIPLELQTKLLRVLQEREFERLGSSRTLRTDARLIAATNRDLEAMVSEQKFRSDLYFRLNVFPVHVPALRERDGDIPLLVRHFTQQFSRRMKKVIETIPSAAMDALCRYDWPGNIRELQNVIERAVIISTGPALSVDVADLKFPKAGPPAEKPASPKSTTGALHDVLEETERQQILKAVKQSNWIVAGPNGAAARLGMKRSTLQKRMHKLGIARGSA
jgi:formate hydrogenlyase transcriptional activator